MQRRSLLEYLEYFNRHGSEIACVHRRGYRRAPWSYRELLETANQFARELEARSVSPGDRILIWGENCAEWVAAFWGSALTGVVAVPLDFGAAPDFAARVSGQVAAKLLVCSRSVPRFDSSMPAIELESLRETLADRSRAPHARLGAQRSDLLEIVFTSGTTSQPRGVTITHGNVLANLEPLEIEIRKYQRVGRWFGPLRFLNLIPLSHVFGQLMGIFVPPLLGATAIFQDALNPSEVIRIVRRERASVLVAVPRLLETLKEKIERDEEAAGRGPKFSQGLQAARGKPALRRWWRFRNIHRQFGWKFWALISGGAALDSGTEDFWRLLGFAVIQGYGMTETTSLISVNHPFRTGRGSIGKLLPGLEMSLSEDGEILVRGENVSSGYWQSEGLNSPAAAAPRQDGWFPTGDLGEVDEAGQLFFKGRKKSVIVTPEGMKIHPEDLEAALRLQPDVRDCVVVGLERKGNAEPCAVLILGDRSRDPEAIMRAANQSLASFQRLRRWLIWPDRDFPRTPTQKPRLFVIQEFVQRQFAAGEAAGGAIPTEAGGLAHLIGRITGRAPVALAPGANLSEDLNLNSIDRVELLSAIEDRYQINLEEKGFVGASTVGELEAILRQPPPAELPFPYPRWAQRWPVTWIRPAAYYLLIWPVTLILGYPRIRGRENLRGINAPVLVVSNHVTYIDIGFILAALPARLRHRVAVAALGETLRAMRYHAQSPGLFRKGVEVAGYALAAALFNVFPLPQQSGFRESFLYAGESVDRGYSIAVFPEGERTRDGKMAPFRAGIGMLAANLNIPVVPIRIKGLFELKQAGKHAARPGAVTVTIGPPMRFDSKMKPEQIALQLQTCVASLERGDEIPGAR